MSSDKVINITDNWQSDVMQAATPVLVDFWAKWCAPCIKKMPDVDALQSKYRDRGLVVIGVHANQNSDGLEEFLTKHPVRFPIALDDGGPVIV